MPEVTEKQEQSYMKGTDFLTLPDGSCYHLGTKRGEVEQRILTVGSPGRARTIAENCFDDGKIEFEKMSSRLMATFNGKFKGVPVSVIAIGMGSPMMDFMVREASYCQPDPIACIRLGTCGIINTKDKPGTVFTADKGSIYSYVNYGYQAGGHIDGTDGDSTKPYFMSKPIEGDAKLHELLGKRIEEKKLPISRGLNACGETFYACQGRENHDFEDDGATENLKILEKAGVDFLEMETHQLFSLAKRRKVKMVAASACIGIVSRTFQQVNISADNLHNMEVEGGRACLEALVDYKFD